MSKKIMLSFSIGSCIVFFILALFLKEYASFFVASGTLLLAYGLGEYFFKKSLSNNPKIKVIENDERNIQLEKEANSCAYVFAKLFILIQGIYILTIHSDKKGFILACILYLLAEIIYLIIRRKID